MFLDVIWRRNPRLIEAAIALHQSGQLPANTYVIDLDAVENNARAISSKAGSLGLTVMAMTKQMGRNDFFCRAVMRGGIACSVAVDLECALATKRAGMELGHIGHLVQIPMGGRQRGAALSDVVDGVQCRESLGGGGGFREAGARAAVPRPHSRRERSILSRARRRVSRLQTSWPWRRLWISFRAAASLGSRLFRHCSSTPRAARSRQRPILRLCDGRLRPWRAWVQGN